MADIKLVAMDLDGTLLGSDLAISPANQEAIRQAQARGVNITICTGRMFASALPYAQALDLNLPLITYNGALVKVSRTGQVLYQRKVPGPLALKVAAMAREMGYPLNVYLNDRLFVESISPEGREYARRARVPVEIVPDITTCLMEEPIKMLVLSEEENLNRMAAKWRAIHGDALYVTKSHPNYLEFLHPEATKGRGLAAVAAALGITAAQTLAIGDSWNDVEMFRWAGFSAAMGNAPAEVKQQATYTTAHCDADGVAAALQYFQITGGQQ